MKIRFRVPEAADPRRESGISLPPQESKRVPPRLRWMLITLLALSPAIWVAWHFFNEWLWVEASGFVVFEEVAIHAPQAGVVAGLKVSNGSQVVQDAPLLQLEDAALRAEYDSLQAALGVTPLPAPGQSAALLAADRQELAALRQRQAALRERSATLRELAARGAATRGEVLAAEGDVLAVDADIQAVLTRTLRNAVVVPLATGPSAEQRARMATLEARLRGLDVRAPVEGTVDNLLVRNGQRVAEAEPMMVLRHGRPQVVVFMQGRDLRLTHSGETVRIVLPNRVTVNGRLLGPAPSTRRLPEELAGALDPRNPRLQVLIEPENLPPQALIHRLPVTIRSFRFAG